MTRVRELELGIHLGRPGRSLAVLDGGTCCDAADAVLGADGGCACCACCATAAET